MTQSASPSKKLDRETAKTLAFVCTALALLALALVTNLTAGGRPAEFRELGTRFFPDFTQPEQATTLEVVEWDPETGAPLPFKVMLRDGRWVIPSHYDYPADARDRLARTAAGIIDLTRETVRSDRLEDHKAMGVLDPLDPKTLSPEGLGKRVTLRDTSDRVLADLIIGKAVAGQPDQRYVREPGKNRVYGVNLQDVELSTRFADWIETNLLKLTGPSVRRVVFENVKADPQQGRIIRGQPSVAERRDPTTLVPGAVAWTLEPPPPAGREVNASALETLTFTLADLRIVGVRPKPPGLTDDLKAGNGKIQLDAAAIESLASKGFYFDRNRGQLVANEGTVFVECDDGVVYSLHFGALTVARGQALSSGGGDPTKEQVASSTGDDNAIESRFLFVMATFDPEAVPKPPERKKDAGELPDDVFARDAEERESMDKQAAEQAQREQEQYQKKLEDGKKRAKDLSERFAGWYYVVPGDAFRKVVLDRDALTREPLPPGPFGPNPGRGLPNIPGHGQPPPSPFGS